MCLAEYFHPQDLIAMGLLFGALACVLRQRWVWTGVLIGLAFSTQQFALLVFVALVAMAPRDRLLRFVIAAAAAAAVIDIPLAILSSGRAIVGIFVGTGASSYLNTVLDLVHLHGSDLYAVSRGAPIVLALVLGWYVADRLGPDAFTPVPLASVIATALTFRLVFEVNFWGYYMMGVAVMLAALDIARGRIRGTYAFWLVAILLVSIEGGLINPPKPSWLDVWTWQLVFVPSALALSSAPLITLIRERRESHSTGNMSPRPVH
jgi:hypothetical protein